MVDGEVSGPGEAGTSSASEAAASESTSIGFAVVTVGSGRSVDQDAAGDATVEAAETVGTVVTREVIEGRYDGVQSTVVALSNRDDVDVIVTVGGTGVAPDDVTIEAVEPLIDKQLPGVGEVIRRECVEGNGSIAIRTRAIGGILDGIPVFCLPGDPGLAGRAARNVVVPEAETLVALAAPDEAEE